MTKLTFTLRAIILSALCVPVVFSCSNYLDFQEDIGNGKDDDGKTYQVSVLASNAEEGEAVLADVPLATEGATITLTASLNAGRRVALSADGVVITPATISANGDTASFTMPAKAVAVTATFSDIPLTLYAISVTPTGAEAGEEVTASVGEAREGTTITLTATLNAGRRVALSAAGVTINPSTISTSGDMATFTMPGNAVTVTAAFSYYAGGAVAHTANTKTFNMHYVPSGGPFIMGEHVQTTTQTVTLTKNFWMGENEVTQGLWEAVWGTTWPGAPTNVPSSTYGIGPNKPAYYVNWYDAVAFCNLLTVADSSIADSERVYYSNDTLTTAYTKANAESNATVYADLSKKGIACPLKRNGSMQPGI